MNRIQKFTWTAVGIFIVMVLCFAVYFYVFSLSSQTGNMWGSVSDSNTARVAQLQNQVKKADQFALRGSLQIANEKYFRGATTYFRALVSLRHAPITQARKAAYQTQFKRAFRRVFGGSESREYLNTTLDDAQATSS